MSPNLVASPASSELQTLIRWHEEHADHARRTAERWRGWREDIARECLVEAERFQRTAELLRAVWEFDTYISDSVPDDLLSLVADAIVRHTVQEGHDAADEALEDAQKWRESGKKDGERLDWLEEEIVKLTNEPNDEINLSAHSGLMFVSGPVQDRYGHSLPYGEGSDLRSAIDAARAATATGNER